jgi:hypothetical protein
VETSAFVLVGRQDEVEAASVKAAALTTPLGLCQAASAKDSQYSDLGT